MTSSTIAQISQSSVPQDRLFQALSESMKQAGHYTHRYRLLTPEGSLRRVQEDVREVSAGFECGILLEGYNDLKEGDVLECYVTRQVERSSLASVAGAST